MSEEHTEERRRVWRIGPESSWKAIVPVVFVIVSLLALAALPIVVSSHTSRKRAEITSIAEPARRAANEIQLDLTSELDKVIAYQVTGQEQFRSDYIALVNQQRRDYAVLQNLGARLGPEVTANLDALIADTRRWHAGVTSGEFLQRQLPSEVYMTRLFERHPAYDRALTTASSLETAIQSTVNDRLSQIHDVERINTALSIVLSALALISALLVIELGRQMQHLAREATRRRQEAEREAGDAKLARSLAESEERRVAFLANAAQELTASLDFTRAVATLARLVVPNLAEACVIDLVDDGGSLRRAAVANRDEGRERIMAESIGTVIELVPEGVARVIRDHEPLVSEPVDPLMSFLSMADLRRSVMVVPLVSRGEVIGVVSAAAEEGKVFTYEDGQFAGELARNASLAIDNAQLYHESQQAVRAREEVLAIVSHDLRNPLNAVNLAASLMQTSTTLAGEDREQLDIIGVSVNRMRRLIEDLLDVTRLEGGKRLPIEPTPVEVPPLLRETHELFKAQAAASNVALHWEATPSIPPVYGDYDRVLQVLSNLVGNALKFTPDGGAVAIRAESQNGMVRFSVSDNGPGIEKEDLKDVFSPYWQAQRTERLGAGLGLPIAKGIVESHGGNISVESQPGRGTTFYFTIPIARQTIGKGLTAVQQEGSPARR